MGTVVRGFRVYGFFWVFGSGFGVVVVSTEEVFTPRRASQHAPTLIPKLNPSF